MKESIALTTLMVMMLSAKASSVEAQSTVVRRPPLPTTILARPRSDSGQTRQPTGRINAGASITLAPGAAAAAAFQPQVPPTPQVNVQTAISRQRIEQVLGGSTAAIRVVRPSGVTVLPSATDSVRIVPGELIFRKMSDTAHRIVMAASTGATLPTELAAGAIYSMPYRWLTIDSAGVQRILVPFFIIKGGGLSYDVQSRKYRGVALVGVEDTLHPQDGAVPLAQPLRLQLTTTSGGTISPLSLAIGHTSLDYDSVHIESSDSTNVRIRTAADQTGIVINVPIRGMTVTLIPVQRSLEGFGLATTDITLTLPRGMGRADSAMISFSASSAPVHPASVLVTGAGTSTVRLRSGLPGQDTIRAFLDGVLVGDTEVTFKRPWTFLGATLMGVVLGGFARFVSAKRRKRARALYWDIIRGLPFGVLAAAASAIGLDLLQFKIEDPGAWMAVMVTALVGAWLGARILDRTAPSPAP